MPFPNPQGAITTERYLELAECYLGARSRPVLDLLEDMFGYLDAYDRLCRQHAAIGRRARDLRAARELLMTASTVTERMTVAEQVADAERRLMLAVLAVDWPEETNGA